MALRKVTRRVAVENVSLWNGEHLVHFRRQIGTVRFYTPGGYAAAVAFDGFRGQFVIPVKRLEVV